MPIATKVRRILLLLLFAPAAGAEDAVHLDNGGVLVGTVTEENAQEVRLLLEAGTLAIPRERIQLIERARTPTPTPRLITRADEWFLVFHRGKVVGWRHLVLTEAPGRTRAEERAVFFLPGGGEDVEIHCVEVAGAKGEPREFLLSERYGGETDSVAGQVHDGRIVAYVRRAGRQETVSIDAPPGFRLPLLAWAEFQRSAAPGETRAVTTLDLRRMVPATHLLRREPDAPAPLSNDPRPCRALSHEGDARLQRALWRPGEGSLAIELNGETLVARRATRERVELAREANAKRRLTPEEALRWPFLQDPASVVTRHPGAGLALRAPDRSWIATSFDGVRGRALEFERVALFASLELFVYDLPSPGADAAACLDRALARLRLAATRVLLEGEPEERTVAGRAARLQEVRARHRGESLRCLVMALPAGDRMVVAVGACPEPWWRWARPAFDSFLATLEVAD
ncbi:MAG: hypothetical protein ACT4PV_06695 [Planctomycetaceae bacterium]